MAGAREKFEAQSSVARRIGYVFSIFFSLVFAWLAGTYWQRIGFLTESFDVWLPILYISVAVTITIMLIRLVFDIYIVNELTEGISNLVSAAATYLLFFLFPFSFDSALETNVVRIALILIIVISLISGIARFARVLIAPYRSNSG